MIIIIFPREVDNDDDNAGNHDDDDDDPRNIFKKWLIVMARSFYQKEREFQDLSKSIQFVILFTLFMLLIVNYCFFYFEITISNITTSTLLK